MGEKNNDDIDASARKSQAGFHIIQVSSMAEPQVRFEQHENLVSASTPSWIILILPLPQNFN